MIVTLTRDPHQPDPARCTLGIVEVAGRKLHMLERPWVPGDPPRPGGTPFVSCVPVGTYRLEPRETEARGRHWLLYNPQLGVYREERDVPKAGGRFLCLIHPANWVHELLGCLAPGKDRQRDAQGRWMVTRSRDAMNELRTIIGNQMDLNLIIQ